jgi:large subunit ribosomal protein L21
MYTVIQTGGKQYKVSAGDMIVVEKIDGEVGSVIEMLNVLLLSKDGKMHIGAPRLSGVSVKAEIVDQFKGDKVVIFKKKRRHNYRRKQGHRQLVTSLAIRSIENSLSV